MEFRGEPPESAFINFPARASKASKFHCKGESELPLLSRREAAVSPVGAGLRPYQSSEYVLDFLGPA
eukprot:CAMPEP_0174734960 /NCGR_PEP_ID=MMETSP1094-20130205/64148_1 /TAXON_ID=156173 /ORGANISM="Chrysochromulina brevifilum, Strain UTEX LB 985" /LENGTH=66 /DNA_ID=CAMNT_0015937861 /DNA_START=59 /DNA_END=255 /DNA_ORIENTATION=+